MLSSSDTLQNTQCRLASIRLLYLQVEYEFKAGENLVAPRGQGIIHRLIKAQVTAGWLNYGSSGEADYSDRVLIRHFSQCYNEMKDIRSVNQSTGHIFSLNINAELSFPCNCTRRHL